VRGRARPDKEQAGNYGAIAFDFSDLVFEKPLKMILVCGA
jgi:hypothetical protein